MDPERWKRIDALLSAALDREEAERASFLAQACEGDEELRQEIQLLLLEQKAAGSFLQTPLDPAKVIGAARPALSANELGEQRVSPGDQTMPSLGGMGALPHGSLLGRYIVLNRIGSGGMGVVYAAYDPELDRKVALKLLRPEVAKERQDSKARERLLREAQAMARLSHPNVISVHDVGTFGEQVFIAMELVDGRALSRWLEEEERRPRAVLEVFLLAGKGLAAAHAAGLVHRDFKPDNVLIGRDGQVKVLDFGLARAAEELAADAPTLPPQLETIGRSTPRVLSARLTRTGAFLGTPAYMAPEQLLRKTTDARTDQFSFCVAVYEALYGQRPFEAGNVEALAQQVAKGKVAEPPKSTRVPGSVRQILLRGLRPNPDERYPSMEALLRELGKDPRAARRRALATLGVTLVLVAAGIGYRQAVYHHSQVCKGAEGRLAGVWDEQKKRALSMAFGGTGKPYAQDAARETQRALDAYSHSWADMQTEACEATRIRGDQSEELLDRRMGCLSERREELKSLVNLFLNPDAKMVANALQATQSLSGLESCADIASLTGPLRAPANAQSRAKVEELRQRLAQIRAFENAGKSAEALPLAVAIVAEAKALHYRPIEAEALSQLGISQIGTGDYKSAAGTLTDAVFAAEASGHTREAQRGWSSLTWLNGLRLRRYEEAMEQGKHGLALIEHLGGDEKLLAQLFTNLGTVLNSQGKYEEALDYHQRAIKLNERIYGPLDQAMAISLNGLGNVLMNQGKLDEAVASFRRAIEIDEKVLGQSHPQLANHLGSLGVALASQGNDDEAMVHMRRDVAILQSAVGPSHPQTSMARGNLAITLSHQGKHDEAITELRRVLEAQQKTFGPESVEVSTALNGIGDVLRAQGKHNEAVEYYQRALTIREKRLGPEHPQLAFILTGIGRSYLALGQPRKALDVLERAAALRKDPRQSPGPFADTQFALAMTLTDLHREPNRARRLATEARDALTGLGIKGKEKIEEIDQWLAKHDRKSN